MINSNSNSNFKFNNLKETFLTNEKVKIPRKTIYKLKERKRTKEQKEKEQERTTTQRITTPFTTSHYHQHY